MNIEETLQEALSQAFSEVFGKDIPSEQITLQPTRKDFEGSHTLVCFNYTKKIGKKPEEIATALGDYLVNNGNAVKSFNVVKGFLNLVLNDTVWKSVMMAIWNTEDYGFQPFNGKEMMVEYASPNTNKPLHLGHLRNIFLGFSVAKILKANGYKVPRVQIINDRGIHICKSMVAWQNYGAGATPKSIGKKGDHLVGEYYVRFDQEYKKQIANLVAEGMSEEAAGKQAPILIQAQETLRKWEQKDPETYQLWETMNGWVYDGFNATYDRVGIDFDQLYYESETYLLGRDEVLQGLETGAFYKKDDGSVWVDLTEEGLDHKLLLRADGTSVYMTQDIGTAILRYRDYPNISGQIYTVGNEQEYHFKVLFLILKKLGYAWAEHCFHLSYGMVDLPSGKMKSREGTVVDADDLVDEMIETSRRHTTELGKIEGFSEEQAQELYETVGMGALKYFLLKVDPKKRMLFDPEESVQFQGNTGPFIQYTHARIAAINRKAEKMGLGPKLEAFEEVEVLLPVEVAIINAISEYPEKVQEAGAAYAPSVIAQYVFDLAKEYNRFYQEIPIFNERDEHLIRFRVGLSVLVGDTIRKAMGLLGIRVPDRM